MSNSRGPVKKLMDKQSVQRGEHLNGNYNRWSKDNPENDHRAGGSAELNSDKANALKLQAIYQQYISVYDKVTPTKRRTVRYRRKATIIITLNELYNDRIDRRSLVEHILNESGPNDKNVPFEYRETEILF